MNLNDLLPEGCSLDDQTREHLQIAMDSRLSQLTKKFGDGLSRVISGCLRQALRQDLLSQKPNPQLSDETLAGIIEKELGIVAKKDQQTTYFQSAFAVYKGIYTESHQRFGNNGPQRLSFRRTRIAEWLRELPSGEKENLRLDALRSIKALTNIHMVLQFRASLLEAMSDDHSTPQRSRMRMAADEGQLLFPVDNQASNVTGVPKRKKK